MRMRFGLHLSSYAYGEAEPTKLFRRVCETVKAAEAAGFDSLWVPDHVQQNRAAGGPSAPMLEAYTLLGALASRTQQITLGALVSPVTFRTPGLIAKMVTTLDIVSSGRAVLGLGAGWDEAEHAAYGISFPSEAERAERLQEAVIVCKRLLGSEERPISLEGAHYALADARNIPHSVQRKIPLLIGGSGEKRTLPIVARYADYCNFLGDATLVAQKLDVLRGYCESIGRDYAEIQKTCCVAPPTGPTELCKVVAERFAVGVDEVILLGRACPSPGTLEEWGGVLGQEFGTT